MEHHPGSVEDAPHHDREPPDVEQREHRQPPVPRQYAKVERRPRGARKHVPVRQDDALWQAGRPRGVHNAQRIVAGMCLHAGERPGVAIQREDPRRCNPGRPRGGGPGFGKRGVAHQARYLGVAKLERQLIHAQPRVQRHQDGPEP